MNHSGSTTQKWTPQGLESLRFRNFTISRNTRYPRLRIIARLISIQSQPRRSIFIVDFQRSEPSVSKPTEFAHAIYTQKLLLSPRTVNRKEKIRIGTAWSALRKKRHSKFSRCDAQVQSNKRSTGEIICNLIRLCSGRTLIHSSSIDYKSIHLWEICYNPVTGGRCANCMWSYRIRFSTRERLHLPKWK